MKRKKSTAIRHGFGDALFNAVNIVFLSVCALVCVLPFIHVAVSSFTSAAEILQKGFVFFPTHPTLDAYRYIFSTNTFLTSLGVSVFTTVVGTVINMIMTLTMAYALAYRDLYLRKFFNFLVMFTMLFGGGMIPTYLLVRDLGMIDSYWALFLPGAISAYNLIIIRNAFQNLPSELGESARIDGASVFQTFIRIALPISMPTIAAFSLMYAVGHWNTFFSAILYLNDSRKWPIQVLLRNLIMLSSALGDSSELDAGVVIPSKTLKMAVIVVATVPILCVYPFLQKHFAKGMLVGSIKG